MKRRALMALTITVLALGVEKGPQRAAGNEGVPPRAAATQVEPACLGDYVPYPPPDGGDVQASEAVPPALSRWLADRRAKYNPNTDRWPGAEGDPITLTWSFVPDGAQQGVFGSQLFAKMDADFAIQGRAFWIQQFQNAFNRWGELTGVTFERVSLPGEEWDDGAPWGQPGADGLRGDIRIWGVNLGTPPGLVASTQLPSMFAGGDITMTTNAAIDWSAPYWNPVWAFQRTLTHEIGHALGLNHVCPNNDTMLMQPWSTNTFAVYGPQHDDMRAAQRLYGDPREPNDTWETAAWIDLPQTSPGTVNYGEITEPLGPFGPIDHGKLSIDRAGDEDWYRFYLPGPAVRIVDLILEPVGFYYESRPEVVGQACPGPTIPNVNSDLMADLRVQLYDWQGQLLQDSAPSSFGGFTIVYPGILLFAGPSYYIRVFSDSASIPEPQQYSLTIQALEIGPYCTDSSQCATLGPQYGTGYCNAGGVCNVYLSADCNYNFIEDAYEPDCDGDGTPDDCEEDCNDNGVPDDCDLADCDGSAWCSDVNSNGQIDGCEFDCNGNGIPDSWDISQGTSQDANSDGVPDECAGVILVPSQYATIGEAVLAAVPGTTIQVADGVYSGPLNRNIVIDKPLTIESEGGPFACTIDLQGAGRAFIVTDVNETIQRKVTIDGFTIANGLADLNDPFSDSGGAILSYAANLKLWRCIFRDNQATSLGGAIFMDGGSAPVIGVSLQTCLFYSNQADRGGGIFLGANLYPNLFNCTFGLNIANDGGALATDNDSSFFALISSIVWRNAPINAQISDGQMFIQYSRAPAGFLASNPGTGNISANPRFVDALNGDFHLQPTSPCIDAGWPLYYVPYGLSDIDLQRRRQGAFVDMGVDEVPPVTPISPVQIDP